MWTERLSPLGLSGQSHVSLHLPCARPVTLYVPARSLYMYPLSPTGTQLWPSSACCRSRTRASSASAPRTWGHCCRYVCSVCMCAFFFGGGGVSVSPDFQCLYPCTPRRAPTLYLPIMTPAAYPSPSAAYQPLLEKLFGGFKLPESSENEYLMKAVMRVIGWVGWVGGARGGGYGGMEERGSVNVAFKQRRVAPAMPPGRPRATLRLSIAPPTHLCAQVLRPRHHPGGAGVPAGPCPDAS